MLTDKDLPPTPYSGKLNYNQIPLSVSNILGISCLMKLHPVVYFGENDGNLIRHVVPVKISTNEISSHGSEKKFGVHVDNPDLELFNNSIYPNVISPDTLSLYCIRKDKSVSTDIILLDDVIRSLKQDVIEILMQPIFNIQRPDSFLEGHTHTCTNQPILAKDSNGNFVSRFDIHRVSSLYKIGQYAIKKFSEASSDHSIVRQFTLNAGDMITFKNKRVLHSRGAFSPKFDGKDRWLLRLFGLMNKPDAKLLVDEKDPYHINTNANSKILYSFNS